MKLDSESLQRLQNGTGRNGLLGGKFAETTPDAKSIRSKRSLSINVNKVSKIVKLNEDGVSAISKVKNDNASVRNGANSLQNSHRFRSVDRAASRGRDGGGVFATRHASAAVEANLFPRAAHLQSLQQANSSEDLKSTVSKASFVKDLYQRNFQSLTPAKPNQTMQGPSPSPGGGIGSSRKLANGRATPSR